MPIKRVVHFSLGKDWFSLPVDTYANLIDTIANELGYVPDLSSYGALKLGRKPHDWRNVTKLEDLLPAKEIEAA